MSIATEVTRLQTAKLDIRNSIQAKGVTVPTAAKLDTYSTYIDSIQTGGGGSTWLSEKGYPSDFLDVSDLGGEGVLGCSFMVFSKTSRADFMLRISGSDATTVHTINWGDGVTENITGFPASTPHTQQTDGTFINSIGFYCWKIIITTSNYSSFLYEITFNAAGSNYDMMYSITKPTILFYTNKYSIGLDTTSTISPRLRNIFGIHYDYTETSSSTLNIQILGNVYQAGYLMNLELPANIGSTTAANFTAILDRTTNLKKFVVPNITLNSSTFSTIAYAGVDELIFNANLNPLSSLNLTNLFGLKKFECNYSGGTYGTINSFSCSSNELHTIKFPTTASSLTAFTFNSYTINEIRFPTTISSSANPLSIVFNNAYYVNWSGITGLQEILDNVNNNVTFGLNYVKNVTDISCNCKVHRMYLTGQSAPVNGIRTCRMYNPLSLFGGSSPQVALNYTNIGVSDMENTFTDLPNGLTFKTISISNSKAIVDSPLTSKTITYTSGNATATCTNTSGLTTGMEIYATNANNTAVTFQDTGDTVTFNNHGFVNGQKVSFTSITTTTGISINTTYYVTNATTNTFQLANFGGTVYPLTNDGSGAMIHYPTIVSIVPNVSITMSTPARTAGTNVSTNFSTLKRSIALLKGWTIT